MTERLLDHETRIPRGAGLRERGRDGAEQAGRHRQIVERPGRLAELVMQLGERRRIGIVAVDVA